MLKISSFLRPNRLLKGNRKPLKLPKFKKDSRHRWLSMLPTELQQRKRDLLPKLSVMPQLLSRPKQTPDRSRLMMPKQRHLLLNRQLTLSSFDWREKPPKPKLKWKSRLLKKP